MKCPLCGNRSHYVQQYDDWYCDSCRSYTAQGMPRSGPFGPAPPGPAPPTNQMQYGSFHTNYGPYSVGGNYHPWGGYQRRHSRDGADLIVGLILMLIILGVVSMLVLAVIFSSFPPWDDHHEDENYIDWSVSVDGGNYLVQVHDIEPIYSRNVGFKLLDNNRLIETVDDPSGEDVRLEGELDDIAYDYNDYRLAELATWPGSTNGTQFYCDYPSGENNRTLYIVFIDADQDGYLCPGDYIWIRSILHDGPAKAGHTLRLSNEFDGEIYGDMILPDL